MSTFFRQSENIRLVEVLRIKQKLSFAVYAGTWTVRQIEYLGLPGELLRRVSKLIALPLTTSTVVAAMGSLSLSSARILGLRALGFFAVTKASSILVAYVAAYLVSPGHHSFDADVAALAPSEEALYYVDFLIDHLRFVGALNGCSEQLLQQEKVLSNELRSHDYTPTLTLARPLTVFTPTLNQLVMLS